MFAANGSAKPLAPKTYIEDVFSTYTRQGNAGSFSVSPGVALATYGGMLVQKDRTAANDWRVSSTALGANNFLSTASTAAAFNNAAYNEAFTTSGFSQNTAFAQVNASSDQYVDYLYRNAPKFFYQTLVTKTAGSNKTVDLSSLGTVGMVKVKRTDSTGSWYTWHRSLTAGKLLIGETTAGETTLGHITVSGTTLTLVDGVIADGTYHIEAYAHDTSADGLIQCFDFTTDGTGAATVVLGFEPQYVALRRIAIADSTLVLDVARGWSITKGPALQINSSATESDLLGAYLPITATGFKMLAGAFGTGEKWVGVAVRRGQMKPPTSGTQVYQAVAATGTGAIATITAGFPPDLAISTDRTNSSGTRLVSRLRGPTRSFRPQDTSAELTYANGVKEFLMSGVTLGADTAGQGEWNASGYSYIHHFLRRYPGVFDMVCYDATGASNFPVAHNLTVTPELYIVFRRDAASASGRYVYTTKVDGSLDYLFLNTTGSKNDSSATAPTSTNIYLPAVADVNASGGKYEALLFASLAGVSKVFKATKTAGADLNVDCQFPSGARFVLMKATASGAWYLWDSVRGIVAGNDPYLLLNSTAAEVTTTDYIDPYAPGFTIVDGGLPNGDYIGVAIS